MARKRLLGSASAGALALLGPFASAAYAAPERGVVVEGSATIARTGSQTAIDQTTDKGIIDWRSFSIGAGESVTFRQPSAASITLNRVTSGDLSEIYGSLRANGRLVLVNPNGFIFGDGARIDVGGLIASTADIANDRFLAGDLLFDRPGAPAASIVNYGSVTAADAGLVALVAPHVANNGIIRATLGRVALAAGTKFTLDLYGDDLVNFAVDADVIEVALDKDGKPVAGLVEAGGLIYAEGGSIAVTAQAARNLIDHVIIADGSLIVRSASAVGGVIRLAGGPSGAVDAGGSFDASGVHGGRIDVSGQRIVASGLFAANGNGADAAAPRQGRSVPLAESAVVQGDETGAEDVGSVGGEGGAIKMLTPGALFLNGTLSVNGSSGGRIDLTGSSILSAGALNADGSVGAGGSINLVAANRLIATAASRLNADGATGGAISLSGLSGGVYSSGAASARGLSGDGGSVAAAGPAITLVDAVFDAGGAVNGGAIRIGFFGATDAPVISAKTIEISPTTRLAANAGAVGNGGLIAAWSSDSTTVYGAMSARGGAIGGDGGFLEASSKGHVAFGGVVDAGASNGAPGTFLLDPKNIIIDDVAGVYPQYQLIDPNPSVGNQFGVDVTLLSGGNTVVTAPLSDFGATDAGAVYLFNTSTGGLISMLTGTSTNDFVGVGGVTALANGNFIVASSNWTNGAQTAAGAVTFGTGGAGVSGAVSSANSLVGGSASDRVGSDGIVALANGNYLVRSQSWDNGAAVDAGAVTFGSGTSGVVGVVSAANSLVGTTSNELLGSSPVTLLTNGNYVVIDSLFDNGAATNAGAVIFGSGTSGVSGAVSTANSLFGSVANSTIGSGGVVALTNGNYVVVSPNGDNGSIVDAGIVTFGSGVTGITGALTAANSLLGASTGDRIGSGGVVALANGNYVVVSSSWDNGGIIDAGAATFGSGASGITGLVTTANSLVGSTASDLVGFNGVIALSNGNYVVNSNSWHSGSAANAGAVTFGSGTTGVVGVVSSANSLVGSTSGDQLGNRVIALRNGNYVVSNPNWDNGAAVDAGAVTFGSGATGVSGAVSVANSLVGSTSGDLIGNRGITTLSNGNYVVSSSAWDNGPAANVGAVTFGSGTTGVIGVVSSANSLVGSTSGDQAGSRVTALSNGNYVVNNPNWDNGSATDAGAVTFGSGTTGVSGAISAANSLVGTTTGDNVGGGDVIALSNGNYVVNSFAWDNGATANAGAITFGSGTTGVFGAVAAANSLVGTTANDLVGATGVTALASGDYVVYSSFWDNGGVTNASAVTFGSGTTGVAGAVSAANSLVGGVSNSSLSFAAASNTGDLFIARSPDLGQVVVGLNNPNQLNFSRAQTQTLTIRTDFLTRTLNAGTAVRLQASNDLTLNSALTINNVSGDGGALTLQAGRSILINANLRTDNGALTIIGNETLANGVVDAQRDPGNAVINMAPGTSIDAGTGAVLIRLANGAGKTNAGGGAVSLRTITAGSVVAENLAAGDLILNGALTAGTGAAPIVLAASNGNFINNAGAGALNSGAGRWLVYSTNPANDTRGGLAYDFKEYNKAYPAAPTPSSGNGFLYTLAPTITPSLTGSTSKIYDSGTAATLTAGNFTSTGAIDGDAVTLTAASASYDTKNVGTNKQVTATGVSIVSASNGAAPVYGYTLGSTAATGAIGAITARAITVTAATDTKTYDGTTSSAATPTATGLVGGDTATGLAQAFDTRNAGSRTLAVLGGFTINDGNGGNNYAVSTQTAAGAINPKALTVTANNASRVYGDANPAFTAAFAGFVAGETQATALTGAPAFATPAIQSSNVGSYAITPSAGSLAANNGNYAFSFVNGTLGVTPAPLTVTADNKTKPQGDPNPALTATFTGLKLGDAPSVVSGLTLSTTALLNSPTGSYPITSDGGTAANYTIAARVDGTLSVQASASAPPPNPDNILAQVTVPSAIVSNLNVEAALKVEPLVDFDLTISDDLRTGTEEETLSDDDRATLELLCIQKVTEACNRLVR